MTRKLMITVGLALTITASQLAAQNMPRGGGRGRGPAFQGRTTESQQAVLPPFYRIFDANQNNSLEVQEVAQVPAILAALDKNSDQQVAADEFCPNPVAGPGLRRGIVEGTRCLSLFDKDHNGALSQAEIADAPNVLAGLDKNNDLKLSIEELCVGRGPGKGAGRRGAGPGAGFGGAGNPNCPLQATGQ